MARVDKRRAKSAKPDAAVAARKPASKQPSWEDQLFFNRLRNHAKWMFLFLALAFAIGFVGFGVGAGGTGIGDIFRGSDSGLPSVSEAREKANENPQDPAAWRELATAAQAAGDTDEGIDALVRYLELRPKDVSALQELAGLYAARGNNRRQEAAIVQARAVYYGGSTQLGGLTKDGEQVIVNPIADSIEQQAGQEITALQQEAAEAFSLSVDAYARIAKLRPDDPNVQLQLAQGAEAAGDVATAIEGYEAFLRLSPDDPNAQIVETQLKRLRAQAGAASG